MNKSGKFSGNRGPRHYRRRGQAPPIDLSGPNKGLSQGSIAESPAFQAASKFAVAATRQRVGARCCVYPSNLDAPKAPLYSAAQVGVRLGWTISRRASRDSSTVIESIGYGFIRKKVIARTYRFTHEFAKRLFGLIFQLAK